MYTLLLFFITILTILYLIFFCRKFINLIYKIENSKDEEAMYQKYNFFKLSSYLGYLSFLILVIILSKYMILIGWVVVYYVLWFIGILFIQLNLRLLIHFLDVLFVTNAVEEIEKDYVVGAVKREKMTYFFVYRLTGDKFRI